MEFLSKSMEDTAKIARDFAISLDGHHRGALVVGLYGELGAGKTTFMKYLAEALGVKETIQSPTFTIMKIFNIQYSIFKKLIHIDAYRLESGWELQKLGWQDIISDPKNLVCIEWPERVEGIMPPHIVLKFEHAKDTERSEKGENTRKISIA